MCFLYARKEGSIVAETKKEEYIILNFIVTFKDSERIYRLIVPPMCLSVTPVRAKQLLDAGVCIEMKK